MKYFIIKLTLITIIILNTYSSKNILAANHQVSVKINLGYPMATFSAGEVYSAEDLAATIYIRPQIMLHFPTYNIAAFSYFAMHMMSSYGLMPLAGMGAGGVFYPSGFPIVPGQKLKNTQVFYKKLAPYFGLGVGISRLSVSDANNNVSFLSNTLDMSAIAGVDYPFNNTLGAGIDVSYSSSFVGGNKNNSGSLSNSASFIFCISIFYYP